MKWEFGDRQIQDLGILEMVLDAGDQKFAKGDQAEKGWAALAG